MKKFLFVLALIAFASLALAQPFVWPNGWSADSGSAVMGGEYRMSTLSDPRTFNPLTSAESNPPGLRWASYASNGAVLIMQGPDSDEWIPYAAASMTVSDDGTVVDIVLRDGVKWSDGTDITVADYLFAYEAETDEEIGSNSYDSWFVNDKKIILEATGDNSLRFTFPEPDRTALPVVAMLPQPNHILGEIYREGGAEAIKGAWGIEADTSTMVWSGPFMPAKFTAGERVTSVRNPHFGDWNKDEAGNALPYLDGIVETVAEGDAALNLYIAGELDNFSPRQLDDVGVINVAVQNGDIDALVMENVAPVASSQFIVFNWNKESEPFKQELFRSSTFRQAMSHLVDRNAMVELIYGGSASPMWSNVYQVLDYWVDNDVPQFPFDPEAAAAKLASLGFTEKNSDGYLVDADGNELGFTLVTNSGNNQREQILQMFTDEAVAVGVNVNAQAIDFNLIVDQLLSEGTDRPFDAILIGLSGGSRDWPFGSNVIPCGTNLHMYNTSGDCIAPQELLMTKLYYQGRSTLDTPAAREIGYKLQQTQAQLQPQIYTVSPAAHYSWLNSVGGQHVDGQINPIVGAREIVLTFKK